MIGRKRSRLIVGVFNSNRLFFRSLSSYKEYSFELIASRQWGVNVKVSDGTNSLQNSSTLFSKTFPVKYKA